MTTAATAVATASKGYLAAALGKLKELSLAVAEPDSSVIGPLMTKLSELDETKAVVIARTLAYQDVFNTLASKEISEMTFGKRYEDIAEDFDSIVDDMKRLVGQAERGSVSIGDRFGNIYMKLSRGDVAYRFDASQKTFSQVMKDSLDQAVREKRVLEAYVDYRGALKESEVLTYDLMKIGEERFKAAEAAAAEANAKVVAAGDADPAERARLELARDEAVRLQTAAEARWQSAKRFSENLSTSYNLADMTFKRLEQITNLKQEAVDEGNSFFTTNKIVFTALKVTMTGFIGLHEATQTINNMKAGRAKAIEAVAQVGDKLLEDATKAAYLSVDDGTVAAMKALITSTTSWQSKQKQLQKDLREQSARNAEQIVKDAEAGRQAIIAAAA
jgi:hypothetical protein